MSHELKKAKRNELALLTKKKGFNPADFEWEDSTLYLVGKHDYRFNLLHSYPAGNWDVVYSPGNDTTEDVGNFLDWDGFLQRFADWLEYLKEELDTPDLWELASQERQLGEAAASEQLENSPFSAKEKKQIRIQLKELETYVKANYQLTATAVRLLERKIRYLEDASTRTGRKDWLNIVQGNLFGLGLNIASNSEQLNDLFRMAWALLGSLFGGQSPELLPQ